MDDNNANNKRRSDIAISLYKERIGSGFRGDNHAMARLCFAEADAFIETQAAMESGEEPLAQRGPRLADVDCPNLPKTHPLRLVGFKVGDLGIVNRIIKHLQDAPAIEELSWDDPVTRTPINWKKDETALARLIFPSYVEAN